MQLKVHMITIEDLVPMNHFLRELEAAIDLSFVYEETETLYSRKYSRAGMNPVGSSCPVIIGIDSGYGNTLPIGK